MPSAPVPRRLRPRDPRGHTQGLAAAPGQDKTFAYVEAALCAAVDTHVPVLAGACAQTQADGMVNALFIQVARMVWGKKWAPVFPVKDLSVGKPTEEKLAALIKAWVRLGGLEAPLLQVRGDQRR